MKKIGEKRMMGQPCLIKKYQPENIAQRGKGTAKHAKFSAIFANATLRLCVKKLTNKNFN